MKFWVKYQTNKMPMRLSIQQEIIKKKKQDTNILVYNNYDL